MANHQIIAGFWVAEESSRSRRVVVVVLVVLVVVGGEVRLGNLVNQGLSSARQAAILASECSQPASQRQRSIRRERASAPPD
jgi:hypothetical protein